MRPGAASGQRESLGFDAAITSADRALDWLPDRIRRSVEGRLLCAVPEAPCRPIIVTFERVAFTMLGDPCALKESIICRKGAGGRGTIRLRKGPPGVARRCQHAKLRNRNALLTLLPTH